MSRLALFCGLPQRPDSLRPAPSGLAPCVWELAVIAHERDAFQHRPGATMSWLLFPVGRATTSAWTCSSGTSLSRSPVGLPALRRVLRQADPVGYFVVMRGHGPTWAEGRPMREQDAWAHAAFMDQLVGEAFVVLGGPISGDDSRIMLIVDCAGEHEVRTRLPDDPWTERGLLSVTSVEACRVLLKGDAASG